MRSLFVKFDSPYLHLTVINLTPDLEKLPTEVCLDLATCLVHAHARYPPVRMGFEDKVLGCFFLGLNPKPWTSGAQCQLVVT